VRIAGGPALDRLQWMLAGLDGTAGWGGDADEVLTPAFRAAAPGWLDRMRQRSAAYAPVVVVGVDAADAHAVARVRRPDGQVDVVGCSVEPAPPHRITAGWVSPLVPDYVSPRLPLVFGPADVPAAPGSRLLVVAGVPGSGKSTLADAVGRAAGVPVFATDWLLGALTPFGGYHLDRLLEIAEEQLTTLAYRQLSLGQSAVLDTPAESVATRERWRSLAAAAGAGFGAVVCVCSDAVLHRSRVEERSRGIPGWHDAGEWADVTRRLASFPPWPGALTVDSARPLEANVSAVLSRYGP
jgi:predicted kinase